MTRRPLGAFLGNRQRSCLLSSGTPCMGHGDGGGAAGQQRARGEVVRARSRASAAIAGMGAGPGEPILVGRVFGDTRRDDRVLPWGAAFFCFRPVFRGLGVGWSMPLVGRTSLVHSDQRPWADRSGALVRACDPRRPSSAIARACCRIAHPDQAPGTDARHGRPADGPSTNVGVGVPTGGHGRAVRRPRR
jgi:hypothetical protein